MSAVAFKGMLHMRPYYDGLEATAFFLTLTPEQNSSYQLYTLFDFGFITCFSMFLFGQLKSRWVFVYTAIDVIETGLILLLLRDVAPWSLIYVGWFTAAKWISALTLLVGLMLKWRRSFGPR